ncbi:hypothetical protein [Natronorubrum sp. DTA28]|uniref:hypothetical protein n=1 Tax=Natronorubrum sp. DTA28 TaxID=3447019 RepID=UPI003F85B9AE
MRRRNYLAGTALGAVTSATALLGGCLDSLETDGTGSGEDTDDLDTSDVDGSADDEENDANDDNSDSTDGDDQDADDSAQDDADDSAQDGDESQDQADESEHHGEDESEQADDGNDENEQTDDGDESTGDGTVEFEVIDMTPSMESGTEFTYIVLAHTDGSESIPGEASLVDETGGTVDSASYEAMSGGGSFELTYQAPTVDEETEIALSIETDHGPVNLGSVRVFPSEADENDDSSGSAENDEPSGSAESGDSSSPAENSTESDD